MRKIEPLETWGMFSTPENRKVLDNYVASFNGSERVVATIVMGMTWNFAVELFNKRLEEQDND